MVVIDSGQDGQLFLNEEKLTDGSTVYDVTICPRDGREPLSIDCVNVDAAQALFALLNDQALYLWG
jgi:hypothetical protein